MRSSLLLAAMTAATVPSFGSDLGPADAMVQSVRALKSLVPDQVESSPGRPGRSTLRVRIEQGSRFLPIPNLVFKASIAGSPETASTDAAGTVFFDGCAAGERVSAEAELADDSFTIRPLFAQRVAADVVCGTDATITFARSNPSASALRVWRVATSAKAKLDAEVGPSAWPRGAMFSVGGSAATNGIAVGVGSDDTTFVVGHELGHAVSAHAGMIQQGFGDSYHQMTACIGDAGALEEGWASFFGAWVDQGLDEPDPIQEWDQHSWTKRRIPIKTVPDTVEIGPLDRPQTAAVCRGTDNEMRVMSFFWNVVSADGIHAPFSTLWKALAGGHLRSVAQAAVNLRELGVDPADLRRTWAAAFKTPCPL
jgi:hypothetical protein